MIYTMFYCVLRAWQNKVRNALLILFFFWKSVIYWCHILLCSQHCELAYWWRYLLLSVAHHFSAYVYKEKAVVGLLLYCHSSLVKWGVFPFYNENQTFSVTTNFSTYPTGPNMDFQCDEKCSLSTMRIRCFLSCSVFDGYQLLNIPDSSYYGISMRWGVVPFQQWESAGFCHYQHLKGINFWTYPTGPTGPVFSEMRKQCSFSTMRLRHFPSQPMFNWYQLSNIPNWC